VTDTTKYPDVRTHWEHFAAVDIPRDAPPIQRHEMQRAFMAGASSGMLLVVRIVKDLDLPRDTWMEISAINAELAAWGAAKKAAATARAAIPPEDGC
jgi:hypothetical protein